MITISCLSPSFSVLENNQFSNKSEQAKMWLFSSAMQRLRLTLSFRPKSGVFSSKRIRSYQIIPCLVKKRSEFQRFCFHLQICLVLAFVTTFYLFQWRQCHFEHISLLPPKGGKQHRLYQAGIISVASTSFKVEKCGFPSNFKGLITSVYEEQPPNSAWLAVKKGGISLRSFREKTLCICEMLSS